MRAILVFVLIFSFISIFADTFEDYFPLNVGDYWIQHSDIYNGGNDPITFTMEHEAIDQINGEDFVRKLNHLEKDDGSYETSWWVWLRATEEGALLGAFGGSDDVAEATIFTPPVLWFPNELVTLGNTYEVSIPEMGGTFNFTTDQVGASVTVPAGTFNNCIVVSLTITDSTNTITQETEYYSAYHVGDVRNYSWNPMYEDMDLELIEYEVNLSSPQNEIPANDFKLCNYPNPFNPESTISFEITTLHEIPRIEIYNLKGQKIRTFSNLQITQSPTQQIAWNGTNDSNQPVSSGIYLYMLTSDNQSVTKKMLLMK
jgi:Secretion system C-terminal sorting domain